MLVVHFPQLLLHLSFGSRFLSHATPYVPGVLQFIFQFSPVVDYWLLLSNYNMTIVNQHTLCISAVPPVYRAVPSPRLGDSSNHPQHSRDIIIKLRLFCCVSLWHVWVFLIMHSLHQCLLDISLPPPCFCQHIAIFFGALLPPTVTQHYRVKSRHKCVFHRLFVCICVCHHVNEIGAHSLITLLYSATCGHELNRVPLIKIPRIKVDKSWSQRLYSY